MDTSSLKVCGYYSLAHISPEDENRHPLPMHGRSKDHQPDLKQLVLSAQTITLEKCIEKALYRLEKLAIRLSRQTFGCEHGARQAAKTLVNKLSYHRITNQISEVLMYKGRGRPKNIDKPIFSHYKLEAEF